MAAVLRRHIMLAGIGGPASAILAKPTLAQGGPRMALVIGNGAYRNVPALPNPARDAQSIARAFTRLGFQADLQLDADRGSMLAAVRRLADAARGAEAVVFYYAGHAVELGGRNLLLPVTASVSGGRDGLERSALPFSVVMEALQGLAQTTLLFLDACRNSPFAAGASAGRGGTGSAQAGTRSIGGGLASVSSASGTLIAFATAPGQVALDGDGMNSPFTTALLAHIETPALEVRQMLGRVRQSVRQATGGEQIPWDNSSLEGVFYFRPPAADPAFRRTIDAASARSIPLPPDLRSRAFRPSPDALGRFVGSWGGDNRWGGRGRQIVLIVLSTDVSARTADVILAYGPGSAGSANQAPPRWLRAIAQWREESIEFEDSRAGWRYAFRIAATDELQGTAVSPDGTRPLIRIRRIE